MPASPPASAPRPVDDPSEPSDVPASPFSEAEDRDALQQLAALLSHRLGSLTSTISGYADLLVDTPSIQEQREIAMNVLEASMQIDDLLADLKYYSRPLTPVPRTVAVRTVVRDTVDLLDRADRERVYWAVDEAAPREIEADPRLLRQALLSLLHNALEASDSSSIVRLNVEADASDALSFDVWNEGEIELPDPQEVFRPFFTTRAQRLGLGLPIAAHIAEQHGGTLHLTSNSAADGGTCFSFRM
jgi:signal transduction histidine kinase